MEKSLVLQLAFKLVKFHGMMMNTFTELVRLGGGVKMLEMCLGRGSGSTLKLCISFASVLSEYHYITVIQINMREK
jgi:hypothetical protein